MADAIVVNKDRIVVRRSGGSKFGDGENWATDGYHGDIGTYFADVTGDGMADAIVVNRDAGLNKDRIAVRRSTGNTFGNTEPPWATNVDPGEISIEFVNVTNDRMADAIVLYQNRIVVRRSNGSKFENPENWATDGYHGDIRDILPM